VRPAGRNSTGKHVCASAGSGRREAAIAGAAAGDEGKKERASGGWPGRAGKDNRGAQETERRPRAGAGGKAACRGAAGSGPRQIYGVCDLSNMLAQTEAAAGAGSPREASGRSAARRGRRAAPAGRNENEPRSESEGERGGGRGGAHRREGGAGGGTPRKRGTGKTKGPKAGAASGKQKGAPSSQNRPRKGVRSDEVAGRRPARASQRQPEARPCESRPPDHESGTGAGTEQASMETTRHRQRARRVRVWKHQQRPRRTSSAYTRPKGLGRADVHTICRQQTAKRTGGTRAEGTSATGARKPAPKEGGTGPDTEKRHREKQGGSGQSPPGARIRGAERAEENL